MMGGVVAFGMSLLVFVWDGPSPSSRTPSTPPIPSSWTRKRDPGPRHQNRTPSTPPIPSSRTRASAIRDLDTRTERLLRPHFRRPGRAQARSGTSTPEPNAFYAPNSVVPDARKRDPGPRHQNRTPSTPPFPSSRTRASAIRDLDTRTERLLRPQFRRPGRASAIRDLDTRTERLLRPHFRRPGRAQARSGTSTPEPNAFYAPNSVVPDARKRDPGPRHQNRTPSTPPFPSSRTRASAIRDLDTRTERLLRPQFRRPGRASAIRDLDTRTERLLRPHFRRPGRAQARSGTSTPDPNAFYAPNSVVPDAQARSGTSTPEPNAFYAPNSVVPDAQARSGTSTPEPNAFYAPNSVVPDAQARSGTSTPEPNAFYAPNSVVPDAQARSGTSTPEPNAFYIPHPESTDKILEKISPFGIRLLNKRELPGPFPPFQRLFPRYCALHCLVLFVPDQPIDPVLSCESGNQVITMFPGALRQIRRHADIQHAARPACKHVDTRRFPHLTMVHGGTVPLQSWAGSYRDPGYRLRRFRDDGKVTGCSGMTGRLPAIPG